MQESPPDWEKEREENSRAEMELLAIALEAGPSLLLVAAACKVPNDKEGLLKMWETNEEEATTVSLSLSWSALRIKLVALPHSAFNALPFLKPDKQEVYAVGSGR